MDGKTILKWGLIVIGLLIAWRVLSGLISSATSSLDVQGAQQGIGEVGPSLYVPNYYWPGVYGPLPGWPMGPQNPGWPFYDAPSRPPRWPGRPYPLWGNQ